MSKNKFSRAIEYGTNKVKTNFNVTLQRTREAVGMVLLNVASWTT